MPQNKLERILELNQQANVRFTILAEENQKNKRGYNLRTTVMSMLLSASFAEDAVQIYVQWPLNTAKVFPSFFYGPFCPVQKDVQVKVHMAKYILSLGQMSLSTLSRNTNFLCYITGFTKQPISCNVMNLSLIEINLARIILYSLCSWFLTMQFNGLTRQQIYSQTNLYPVQEPRQNLSSVMNDQVGPLTLMPNVRRKGISIVTPDPLQSQENLCLKESIVYKNNMLSEQSSALNDRPFGSDDGSLRMNAIRSSNDRKRLEITHLQLELAQLKLRERCLKMQNHRRYYHDLVIKQQSLINGTVKKFTHFNQTIQQLEQRLRALRIDHRKFILV